MPHDNPAELFLHEIDPRLLFADCHDGASAPDLRPPFDFVAHDAAERIVLLVMRLAGRGLFLDFVLAHWDDLDARRRARQAPHPR